MNPAINNDKCEILPTFGGFSVCGSHEIVHCKFLVQLDYFLRNLICNYWWLFHSKCAQQY